MMDGTAYFKINDLNLIAKMDDYVPYVYHKDVGWQVDNDNKLMDRLIGYDGDGIGSSDEMDNIEEISEAEALKLIVQ